MGEKPSQRVSLWSQLDLWHDPTSLMRVEGRYVRLYADVWCRLCGCLVHEDYIASHDAHHEEQGY